MSFSLYFSKKIALTKDNQNNLSRVIVFIGRISVALGVIVSLITVCTGLGSKRAIKERTADFSGHITIKSKRSNSSYNTSPFQIPESQLQGIKNIDGVESVQKFATVSGILRTEKDFAGIIFKGVGRDFDASRFRKFLMEGTVPTFTEKGYNNSVMISQSIANDLHLKLKDSIVAIFSNDATRPVYRKFEISGIYKTDIKQLDELYMIGDINHVRKILHMESNEVGGEDVFLQNTDDIDQVFPVVEKAAGWKTYSEKATDKYPQIVEWIKIFDTNIALIIIIMLSVVVINIIMVLLILIIERTNSIGMLKALGADNTQIRRIFINYTLLIMVPGLVAGNAIGLGFLLIQKFFGIIRLDPANYYVSVVPVELNPLYIVMISAGMLAVSAVALILPSHLISKISPLKAIRYS